MDEIWIVGATGRIGRGIAADLAARQASPVLVGRDDARLREVAASLGGEPRVVVAGSVDAVAAEIARGRPAVVVNTIGPFGATAPPLLRAGTGSHYVDLANELAAVTPSWTAAPRPRQRPVLGPVDHVNVIDGYFTRCRTRVKYPFVV